jgi:hypothetical protein
MHQARRPSPSARHCSRRAFLRGAAGATLALPWLESVARAAPSAAGPRRVIVVTYDMGVPMGAWRPSTTGSAFSLPYVTAPLAPFQDRCLFVSNIDNTVLDVGDYAWGHPAKRESVLTGTLPVAAFAPGNDNHVDDVRPGVALGHSAPANGPSVESLIGARLFAGHARRSVDLGVPGDGSVLHWEGGGVRAPSHYFFESSATPVTLEHNPASALAAMFAGVMPSGQAPDPAAAQARFRRKSVLDAVRESFTLLRTGLPASDRRRLDEHAARIRQLELDVAAPATCTLPGGIDVDPASHRGRSQSALADLQVRILAQAMACDVAPVGRLEFSDQHDPFFGLPAVDDVLAPHRAGGYGWHSLVHGSALPGTSTPTRHDGSPQDLPYHPALLQGYRFYVQKFADLLAQLDAIPEGEGTVLDHSLVLLASDLGEGLGHHHGKMGFILAGNLGGARAGFHLDALPTSLAFQPSRPAEHFYAPSRFCVSQLLHSILDMADVRDAAGAPATMGLRDFLPSRGLPRRIDALFT